MKNYSTKPKESRSDPILRDRSDVVAILAADLHFSLKPPIARSSEPDWLETQRGYIRQLRALSLKAPVIVAGDIFDKWNAPAELVNMLLKEMPQIYAVCGNHDLPCHNYEQRKRSAYWTLVEADKLTNLNTNCPVNVGGWHPIKIHGFPHGSEVKPLQKPNDLICEIAVIHDYLWTDKKGSYPGASAEKHIRGWEEKLVGYDVVLFGDNHQPISIRKKDGQLIFQPGGFMRRKMDEKDHRPSVGLLKVDAKGERRIERHYLDVSQDRFIDEDSNIPTESWSGMEDLLNELSDLGDSTINFEEALRRAIEKVPIMVREAVINSLERK